MPKYLLSSDTTISALTTTVVQRSYKKKSGSRHCWFRTNRPSVIMLLFVCEVSPLLTQTENWKTKALASAQWQENRDRVKGNFKIKALELKSQERLARMWLEMEQT